MKPRRELDPAEQIIERALSDARKAKRTARPPRPLTRQQKRAAKRNRPRITAKVRIREAE